MEKEAQSSPTPSLAPSDKMAQPHKSIGLSWGRLSAFNQSRFFHVSSQGHKDNMGDREEQDMPAAGIATGGPSKGSSNIKDAGMTRLPPAMFTCVTHVVEMSF